MPTTFAKVLNKPSARRSRWFLPSSVNWDLRYLGWGSRFYSVNPTPTKRALGWSCHVVKRGSPILTLEGRKRIATAGSVFIFGPECAHGWTDRPHQRSEFLVWIWKSAPRSPHCRPPSDRYLEETLNSAALRRVEQIHAACRQEVSFPDPSTPWAMESLRLELEVLIARLKRPVASAPSPSRRVEQAVRWMKENLASRRPITFLCDYLQMSSGALERLFLDELGETPSSCLQRLKMEHAGQLLAKGKTVKEVAYSLGYTHANDFSRAFRTFRAKHRISRHST